MQLILLLVHQISFLADILYSTLALIYSAGCNDSVSPGDYYLFDEPNPPNPIS